MGRADRRRPGPAPGRGGDGRRGDRRGRAPSARAQARRWPDAGRAARSGVGPRPGVVGRDPRRLALAQPRSTPGRRAGGRTRFLGGLLATCGPDNIGEPRAGSDQHGTHHLTPAYDVSWRRERTPDGWQVRVRGSVAHTSLAGPRIVVDREIVAGTGVPAVEVVDVVRNVGDRPVGVPLLYHVNLGAPLLRPGARLAVTAGPTGDARAAAAWPRPAGHPGAAARARPGGRRAPAPRRPRATLVGDADHPDVDVTWDLATLPRLYTWSWPARGAYVLGVEPANAPLFGPDRDLPYAGAPDPRAGADVAHRRPRRDPGPPERGDDMRPVALGANQPADRFYAGGRADRGVPWHRARRRATSRRTGWRPRRRCSARPRPD